MPFVLLLLVLWLAWIAGGRFLPRLAIACVYRWGAWRTGLAITDSMELLYRSAWWRMWDLRLSAHQGLGDVDAVLKQALGSMAWLSPGSEGLWQLNHLVNALIFCGRYQEALALGPTAISREALLADARFHRFVAERVLVEINLAEALYNRGEWEEAWRVLAPLDADAERAELTRSGLLQQRAWIAASQGRVDDARALLTRVLLSDLPPAYRSETHFTWALLELQAGKHLAAREAVALGQRVAQREPSRRNALFLLGRIAYAEGKREEAIAHFRAGARRPYRGQGGEGLLLWGDALRESGRLDEARRAWELTRERDPQSAAAGHAASRLREPSGQ